MLRRIAIAALALAPLAGCAGQSDGTPSSWYRDRDAVQPRGDRIMVCHGYDCGRRTALPLSPADLAHLAKLIAAGSASPAEERMALGRAVQWFENKAAPALAATRDRAKTEPTLSGQPGQMDCIDEATNTTSLLLLASKRGLLTHHKVGAPAARGFFLDGRYPHVTAVLIETATDHRYAIDSWIKPSGGAPEIMDLDTWFASRTPRDEAE